MSAQVSMGPSRGYKLYQVWIRPGCVAPQRKVATPRAWYAPKPRHRKEGGEGALRCGGRWLTSSLRWSSPCARMVFICSQQEAGPRGSVAWNAKISQHIVTSVRLSGTVLSSSSEGQPESTPHLSRPAGMLEIGQLLDVCCAAARPCRMVHI